MVGFRNIAVHDYQSMDVDKNYHSYPRCLFFVLDIDEYTENYACYFESDFIMFDQASFYATIMVLSNFTL